ncbi:PP0621 family protein [Limnohabitans sp.]|jgi:uncharacterized protein|uniref:PP0621 family protein n=1 Tax=Limnohabitans sp. TaxID=1907725 RepID=UPI0026258981|nr:PP0621 family protein [Limnohabitans sp.]
MKFLFLLLVALVVIWAVKRSRVKPPAGSAQAQSSSPTEMVACAHCGIHLPRAEAVSGQKGLYCSTEHRSAAQDSNPA